MLNGIEKFCSDAARWQCTIFGLALVGVIALLDFITGPELSFSIFYLIPIALISWYAERSSGYFMCAVSALAWFLVEHYSNRSYTQEWIFYWNAVVRLAFFVFTSHLLSALRMYLEREHALLRIDELTGAKNSRAFKEETRFLFKLAARHNHPIVLASINVDNFKCANDAVGRAEGDRILQTIVMALTLSVRSTDVVGRLGEDEFAVLLSQTDQSGAKLAFDKLNNSLLGIIEDKGWKIGISIGVVVFPDNPPSYSAALRYLETLAQRVKREDVGHVVYEVFPGSKSTTQGVAA